MAEKKKRTTPFVPPKSFKEAGLRAGRRLAAALGAFGRRQSQRIFGRPAQGTTQPRDTGPRQRPAPSIDFELRQLGEEANQMLGIAPEAVPQTTVTTPAQAAPVAPAQAAPPPSGFVAGQRRDVILRRRERMRMQGLTDAEINELAPLR